MALLVLVVQVQNIFLLLAAFFSLAIGFFVWWQNRKDSLNIIFGLLTLSLAVWQFGTFMMLNSCAQRELVIFWDRFVYLGVIFISLLIYHFVLVLTQKIKEKIQKTILSAGYILAFMFLLLSRTDYFIKDVFQYKWGCHSLAQAGHHLFLIYFTFFIIFSFYLLWKCFKTTQDLKLKAQTKYVLISFILLYIGAVEFLPAYEIAVFPFGYPFTMVWLIFWTYVITRYQLLNIKVIATDILIGTIAGVILIFAILSENTVQFIGRGIFLILVSISGYLTIRGVHREVEEKERLETAVQERTRELQKRKEEIEKAYEEIKKREEELERFYKLAVGRELKMAELKEKIKGLEEQEEQAGGKNNI